MDRQMFWSLIELSKDSDTECMFDTLAGKLTSFSAEEVGVFRSYIFAYMNYVNDCVWVDMACKVINGYVSDDTGLYFALWLIAQGEETVHRALVDPDSLAELEDIRFGHTEFEMLMMVGEDEPGGPLITGDMIQKHIEEIEPTIVYRGGEKHGSYDSFEDAMSDIRNVLPNLIQRAKKENFAWETGRSGGLLTKLLMPLRLKWLMR